MPEIGSDDAAADFGVRLCVCVCGVNIDMLHVLPLYGCAAMRGGSFKISFGLDYCIPNG